MIMSGPFGNHEDKFANPNPIARWMMRGFVTSVVELCKRGPHRSLLEAGCGEGQLSIRLAQALSPERFDACDLAPPQQVPLPASIHYHQASIYRLPFPDKHFDLVLACEVLEHLEDPRLAILELCRVTQGAVVISTPREPLWRALNVLRGRYVRAAGNTPGHIQHFSRRALWKLCEPYLEDLQDRCPPPWTILRGRPRR